jgi:hypothetical protein
VFFTWWAVVTIVALVVEKKTVETAHVLGVLIDHKPEPMPDGGPRVYFAVQLDDGHFVSAYVPASHKGDFQQGRRAVLKYRSGAFFTTSICFCWLSRKTDAAESVGRANAAGFRVESFIFGMPR